MRKITTAVCIGLFWLLAAGPLSAAEFSMVYLAEAEAEVDIEEDGTVSAVRLARTPAIEGEIGERLEERMRAWRFKPVRNEAGEAMKVVTTARMQLEATPGDGDDEPLVVRTRQPSFTSRGLGERARRADWEVGGQIIRRVQPRFPSSYPAANARVIMKLSYDASGRVIDSTVHTAQLLDVAVGERDGAVAQRILGSFIESTRVALQRWRFPASADGGSVLVPVQFDSTRSSRGLDKWRMAVNIPALEDGVRRNDPRDEGAPAMLAGDDSAFGLVTLLTETDEEIL